MPSQLYDNDGVTFICARNFTYNGESYEIGAEFPQEDLVDSPEVLVRSRYLIPVVESWEDKPRHWHREIQLKSTVLEKLGVTGESLLNKPTRVIATEDLPVKDAVEAPGEFDPNEHTVEEVNAYLADPENKEDAPMTLREYNRVVQAEMDGQARAEILDEHELIEEPVDEEMLGSVEQTHHDATVPVDGEQPGPEPVEEQAFVLTFNPSEHTVPEVNEYLSSKDISVEEYNEVIQAEKRDKNRVGILNEHQLILEEASDDA